VARFVRIDPRRQNVSESVIAARNRKRRIQPKELARFLLFPVFATVASDLKR
jgi:hypothetical protein